MLQEFWERRHQFVAFFVILGCGIIILDPILGFQGLGHIWSDVWHHRAVLLELSDSPFNPTNPHIDSASGSRSFIPLYVLLGIIAFFLGLSPDALLFISVLVNLSLLLYGGRLFAKSLGSKHWLLLIFVLFYAWLEPPNYTGFHNLRTFAHTISFPAAHAFALTLIVWGFSINTLTKTGIQIWRWAIIILLLCVIILSHQFAALFCIGGSCVFVLLFKNKYWAAAGKMASAIIIAVIISFYWPYFDLSKVFLSGTNKGWVGNLWFYDPYVVAKISLPAFAGLIYLFRGELDRKIHILAVCAFGLFAIYILTYFYGIGAGHRLLSFWIFFLHLIIFLWLDTQETPAAEKKQIINIKPIYLFGLMGLALFQCAISLGDVFKDQILSMGINIYSYQRGDYYQAGLNISNILPDNAIVVAKYNAAYPVQAFGVPVVSLPRETPMIADLSDRQEASKLFFSAGATCLERLASVKEYGATYAAIDSIGTPEKIVQEFVSFGEAVVYDDALIVIKIPVHCKE